MGWFGWGRNKRMARIEFLEERVSELSVELERKQNELAACKERGAARIEALTKEADAARTTLDEHVQRASEIAMRADPPRDIGYIEPYLLPGGKKFRLRGRTAKGALMFRSVATFKKVEDASRAAEIIASYDYTGKV